MNMVVPCMMGDYACSNPRSESNQMLQRPTPVQRLIHTNTMLKSEIDKLCYRVVM